MRNELRARRRALLGLGALALLEPAWAKPAAPPPPEGQVLRVGPDEAVRTLAGAAKLARDDMVIEVAAGDYPGDVASWTQNRLTLKAVGGRVRLLANGAAAQSKGIFVISGEQVSVSGFDFIGAAAPDTNGAGIRFERGALKISDCLFSRCEMGVLTNNEAGSRLEIENCEFSHGRRPSNRPSHLLYAGAIARLIVSGCYFHHGHIGHLIKSRAALNRILYNRLTDEPGGSASYELEFPIGGRALVMGNLIQQSAQTENPHLISYGAEGYQHKDNALWLINNTLVDNRPRDGIYLRVESGGGTRVQVVNNLLVGGGHFGTRSDWDARNNPAVDWDAFVLAARENYALRPGSSLRGKSVDPGPGPEGLSLRPTRQYQHPHRSVALAGPALNPGALQLP